MEWVGRVSKRPWHKYNSEWDRTNRINGLLWDWRCQISTKDDRLFRRRAWYPTVYNFGKTISDRLCQQSQWKTIIDVWYRKIIWLPCYRVQGVLLLSNCQKNQWWCKLGRWRRNDRRLGCWWSQRRRVGIWPIDGAYYLGSQRQYKRPTVCCKCTGIRLQTLRVLIKHKWGTE